MKKILLVEDDPFIVDVYANALKREGYGVNVANNSQLALENIENNCPDLVILDLNLNNTIPGPKDGLEILKTLRRNPRTKDLKVVIFSNYSAKDYPELSELPQIGVSKIILKVESTSEDMIKIIKEILK